MDFLVNGFSRKSLDFYDVPRPRDTCDESFSVRQLLSVLARDLQPSPSSPSSLAMATYEAADDNPLLESMFTCCEEDEGKAEILQRL